MPSASARSSAGKKLDICKYCQRVYMGGGDPFPPVLVLRGEPRVASRALLPPRAVGPSHREHVEASDTIDNVKA